MSALRAAVIPVTAFNQNCTLLFNDATKSGAVIDPGGDLERIEAAIKQIGMSVEKILLTHGHLDHAGGAEDLRARLKVKIEGPHIADKPILDSLGDSARKYGLTGMKPVTPDRWLNEGDSVTVGGVELAVLHCPGHSPGSVVFFSAAQRFALVGDVIFQGSVGRTDFPFCSHEELMRSIKQKILPLGDDVAFICGHGPMSTIGEERKSNPFIQ